MKPKLLALLVAVCLSVCARGADLTTAQLQSLKAAIVADDAFNAFEANPTPDGAFAVADAFNLAATPDFWVWRTSVSKSELVNMQSTDADGSTTRSFIWAGNGFITRSVGEQAAWQELFNGTGTVNPSLPNVRQAFTEIFSGTGNAASNRTHLANVGRRKAKRIEKVYATGTGTAASPATMTFEGSIAYQDVLNAMATQ